ncbi:MAG: hypothetical protein GX607_21680 [Myxococcales bacterium]|jgi:hypothetical protein|nr:hypothetical protein [Myxococcales bacterium]
MGPRLRSLGRWALGTLLFGSAFLLVDISLHHFLHLRRPHTDLAAWHLRVALVTGAAGLLTGALGVALVRRWSRSARRHEGSPRPEHR